MPIAMRRKRGVSAISVQTGDFVDLAGRHTHFYVGMAWFKMTPEERIKNPPPLDPCIFHGVNCTVGICIECWLGAGKKTIHHFMPDLPHKFNHKPKKKERGKK